VLKNVQVFTPPGTYVYLFNKRGRNLQMTTTMMLMMMNVVLTASDVLVFR